MSLVLRAWLVTLVLTGAAAAQTFPEKAAAIVARFAGEEKFSGSVLVAHDGRPLYRESVGLANRERSIPNAPDTGFHIGSMSKQFTAAAILKLAEAGALKLDDPISLHVPHAPDAWDKITIRHLLTHESGFPDYLDRCAVDAALPRTPAELIEWLRDRPLKFSPGTGFEYGSSGYAILGYVIEILSHRSYADYLRAEIFDPLGLRDTGYDDGRAVIARRAEGYRPDRPANYGSGCFYYSSAGLYSTVDDMLAWDRALSAERVLGPAATRAMFTASAFGYGLGWFNRTQFGRAVFRHSGYLSGFSAQIERYPADRLTVIVLGNRHGLPAGRLADELAAAYFGVPPE